MTTTELPLVDKGNIYIVHGDGDGDVTSWKIMLHTFRWLGYKVIQFTGPTAFLRELAFPTPSVLLLDTRVQNWSGVALQAVLNDLGRKMPVVFLGSNLNPREIVTAMKQGAVDFIVQPYSAAEMCAVMQKAMLLDMARFADLVRESDVRVRLKSLTEREREVCFLMVRGFGNTEIAELNGSVAGTVKLHRSRVLEKMGVSRLAELVTLINGVDHLRWHVEN